jgi:hypothetical protein
MKTKKHKSRAKNIGQRFEFYCHQFDTEKLKGTVEGIFYIDDMKFYVVKADKRLWVVRFIVSVFMRDGAFGSGAVIDIFKDSYNHMKLDKKEVNSFMLRNIETIKQLKK